MCFKNFSSWYLLVRLNIYLKEVIPDRHIMVKAKSESKSDIFIEETCAGTCAGYPSTGSNPARSENF
jgi:hypothetical protein